MTDDQHQKGGRQHRRAMSTAAASATAAAAAVSLVVVVMVVVVRQTLRHVYLLGLNLVIIKVMIIVEVETMFGSKSNRIKKQKN